MAYIGRIYLAGGEGHPNTGEIYNSGICFFLNKTPKKSDISTTLSENWEIEINESQNQIFARSKNIYSYKEIIAQGFECCQKFLDMKSVIQHESYLIEKPEFEYIIVYNVDGSFLLRDVSKADLVMGVECSFKVSDKDGNEKASPREDDPKWRQAFRYYRLSQTDTDCYNAYRNLFLSFESLIDGIYPYAKEGEKNWLKESIRKIQTKFPLDPFVPAQYATSPADYIIEEQYVKIRCGLFHAKDRDIIIPQAEPNSSAIIEAYQYLLPIWRHILTNFANVHVGEGVITQAGFSDLMNGFGGIIKRFVASNDGTPDKNDDNKISPENCSVFIGDELGFNADYGQGLALFYGIISSDRIPENEYLNRFGFENENELLLSNYRKDGINPKGTKQAESHQIIRLINGSTSKTTFG